MRTQITVMSAGQERIERLPIHPNKELREATAQALNEGGELPRADIQTGSMRLCVGTGPRGIEMAWIWAGGAQFALATRVFESPWQPNRASGWQAWEALTLKNDSEVAA